MTRYTVTLTGIANYTTDVEADSPEQAVDRAEEDAPSLCVHCTSPHTGAYAELGDDWRRVAVYDEHGTPMEPEADERPVREPSPRVRASLDRLLGHLAENIPDDAPAEEA